MLGEFLYADIVIISIARWLNRYCLDREKSLDVANPLNNLESSRNTLEDSRKKELRLEVCVTHKNPSS